MKKIVILFIFGLSVMFADNAMAQTRQTKSALQQVEAEIRDLEREANSLDTIQLKARITSLQAKIPLGAYKNAVESAAIIDQIQRYEAKMKADKAILSDIYYRLDKLYNQRQALKELSIKNALQEKTPKELKNIEKKRRVNSLYIRSGEIQLSKEELSLKKLEETSVNADKSQGYRVLIWNQDRYKYANFSLSDATGQDLDGGAFYLAPGEKIETYLLPGKYLGTVKIAGRGTGFTDVYVSIRHKMVNGTPYHGYLIQPSR